MATRFITKGKGRGRKVIPLKSDAVHKRYALQKVKMAGDIEKLKANRKRLISELGSAKKHMIEVMKDSGHTIQLLRLSAVRSEKDKKLVVVAKVKRGNDVFHHIIDDVILKEKMLADDFKDIIRSIKSKYHKTIEIWR